MIVRHYEVEELQKRNVEMHQNEKNLAMDDAKIYYKNSGRKGIRVYLRERYKTLTRQDLTDIIGYWDEYYKR